MSSESWKTKQQFNTGVKVKVAEKVVVSQRVKCSDGGMSSKPGSVQRILWCLRKYVKNKTCVFCQVNKTNVYIYDFHFYQKH